MTPRQPRAPRGNYVSEWYSHRVYPAVHESPEALSDQQASRCPMLSRVTGESLTCIKAAASQGICTISSASSGTRHDWLVCPLRAIDADLLDTVARRLYRLESTAQVLVVPAPTLARDAARQRVIDAIRSGVTTIVYLQNKLGGEISIAPTDRSPELSFDVTMVQIFERNERFELGQYGIFEIQAVDFHGSYRAVTKDLKDALRLHGAHFHQALRANPTWLSKKIESPNVANVFKRTFYQMVFKFQMGADETCAGCALAIPLAVWESWQRHLGNPELFAREDGLLELLIDGTPARIPAWIYVFEIDNTSSSSPNPIRIVKTIATDADAIIHYALKVAPEAAVAGAGSADRVLASIRRRLGQWWPALRS